MSKLLMLYKKLLGFFGFQGWWPVTDTKNNKPSYGKRKNLTEAQKFEVFVGAILTQSTSWKNVEKALQNLKKNNLFSPQKINRVSLKKLALIIKPSGYFNQKAIKLKKACSHLKKYDYSLNKFFKKPLKELREELLSIHGIGNETADSIILYAAQKPIFVVDAYTKRILTRFLGQQFSDYLETQKFFHTHLKKDTQLFNEFHALLVALGKNFCLKSKPKCIKCPLNSECLFFKEKGFQENI
jgi:endonuclease-3 related protein